MIKELPFDNGLVRLFDDDLNLRKSIFTILIGKNGTGKSRLLNSLTEIIRNKPVISIKKGEPPHHDYSIIKNTVHLGESANNIVAISISPFDKFTLSNTEYGKIRYHYLGVRGLASGNFSVAYLSRMVSHLLRVLTEDPSRIAKIQNVLTYLGYKPKIVCEFNFSPATRSFWTFYKAAKQGDRIDDGQLYRWLDKYSSTNEEDVKDFLSQIIEVGDDINKVRERYQRKAFSIAIGESSIIPGRAFERLNVDYSRLVKYGLIRLKDIRVTRLKSRASIQIIEASSGEQSVLVSFLGISCFIDENSIICIDEPEICLHPQWQEKYMQLLIGAFGTFENCQFVIATHSPQIISSLQIENCYVFDMEQKRLIAANEVASKSADFQLATIFRSPGFKNEYLLREFLGALAEFASSGKFDSKQRKKLIELVKVKEFLSKSDPAYELAILMDKALRSLR